MKPLKRLYIRLSSLGDVVLARDAVTAGNINKRLFNSIQASAYLECHFLSSVQYKDLFWDLAVWKKFHGFDRSESTLFKWIKFCQELCKNDFDEVIDLHSSLRSLILRTIFLVKSPKTKFIQIQKNRFALWGYFIFKSLWPVFLRPKSWFRRFLNTVNPNAVFFTKYRAKGAKGITQSPAGFKTVAVMPDSRWQGKCWPVNNYEEVLRALHSKHQIKIAVLGSHNDKNSKELVQRLVGLPVQNLIGKMNFKETENFLSGVWFYLGSDTGLAHLTESTGRPALILYGPTKSDQGFGPRLAQSLALERTDIICRPCSKDGKRCYRLWEPHACLQKLNAPQVLGQIEKWIENGY